jgi:hypothetical protein
MQFETLEHVNVRTPDGRNFAAMAGTTSEVADADTELCEVLKATGNIKIIKAKPGPKPGRKSVESTAGDDE